MIIIGCDFHTRYQPIAMAREETSESLVERLLAEVGHELWIGESAKIRGGEVLT